MWCIFIIFTEGNITIEYNTAVNEIITLALAYKDDCITQR